MRFIIKGFLFVIISVSFVNAQEIGNLHFEQEGKMIFIYYDLKGENNFDIKLYCSQDGGKTWGQPLNKAIGAVGKDQNAGYFKMIKWDVLAEKERLQGNVVFKIEAIVQYEVRKPHRFDDRFSPADEAFNNKIFQLGLGFGIDRFIFTDYGQSLRIDEDGNEIYSDSSDITINGIGIKGEIYIHPYINNYFSVGFIGAYSIGTKSLITQADQEDYTLTIDESYFYTRFFYGVEIAGGIKPLKIVFKADRLIQTNEYDKSITDFYLTNEEYHYSDDINQETLSIGLRLPRYSGKYEGRRGNIFDFVYTLTRDFPFNWNTLQLNDYYSLSEWRVGFGFMWWRQSAIKLKLDLISDVKQKDFNNLNFRNGWYQISFIYNYNWFL